MPTTSSKGDSSYGLDISNDADATRPKRIQMRPLGCQKSTKRTWLYVLRLSTSTYRRGIPFGGIIEYRDGETRLPRTPTTSYCGSYHLPPQHRHGMELLMAFGLPSLATLAGLRPRRAYVQRSKEFEDAIDVIEIRLACRDRRIPRKSREDCPQRAAAVEATLARLRRSAA